VAHLVAAVHRPVAWPASVTANMAFPVPHGRGDEFHHGSPGLDHRSLPKGPKPRDIEDPYRRLDQIRVKTRDFR
jgi:error-prone DNA polymerase